MKYAELAAINVNEHVEKKNNLSYLSWAWAVDQIMRLDNDASWEYGEPQRFQDTLMVFCTVSAFGRKRTAQLPVMDYKNKAISEPDAFQVNVAMQRCLAKAIALHGIGLYIYAGEDVPQENKEADIKEVDIKVVDIKVVDIKDKNLGAILAKDILESEFTKQMVEEAIPPDGSDEAGAVDWIVSFIKDWIPSLDSKDSLRDFWKINKASLSRVKAFSKPMYDALEESFKQAAKEKK